MLFVLCVATEINEGVELFIKSMELYNYKYKILGLGKKWNGGNTEIEAGGGQKINLLKEELINWDIDKLKKTTIIFTDSYDVIFLQSSTKFLEIYSKFNKNNIIFSSEKYCWPNKELEKYYPITNFKNNYLNSGGFIGLGINILNLINQSIIKDNDDDQLYFTNIFLSNSRSYEYKIELDYKCELFQTLNNSLNDISINCFEKTITNNIYKTSPCVIHANGPGTKKYLSTYFKILFDNNYLFLLK